MGASIPLLTLSFNEEPDQYLFAYVLRPGNAGAGVGAIGILSRLLPRLRAAFPRARLRMRLDDGFAAAGMFAFCEREGLEYVIAMGKNKVLERRAARLMGTVRRLSRESGETAHLYSETRYAAGTWKQRRRVVIKAEVVRHRGCQPKDNPRFVVANLKHSPRHLYEASHPLEVTKSPSALPAAPSCRQKELSQFSVGRERPTQ